MPTLRDLQAQFLRVESRDHYREVDSLAEAHGVMFLCPKCFATNGGPRGTHGIICWSKSAGAPGDTAPLPGRWRLAGTGIDDLSLMEEPGKTRSVLLTSGCRWHGYVTNGSTSNA